MNLRKNFFCLTAALVSPALLAHHGSVTNPVLYQADELIVLEGEMPELFWRNPHVRGRMTVADDSGEETVWEVELGPGPPGMENRNITEDDLLGRIRVAGHINKRKPNSIGALNVLMTNGLEFSMGGRSLMWASETTERAPAPVDPALEAEERRTADRIFRTWTQAPGGPERNDLVDSRDWLSERGREVHALYDPVADNLEVAECRQGMPDYMFDPVPIRITDEGDRIEFESWEYNGRRAIYMDSRTRPEPEPSSTGYSTGRWVGETLVVTTTHIDWPYWSEFGLPQSTESTTLLEKFSVSEDGNTLNYSVTVSDPEMFTRPFTVQTIRRWTPGRIIPPYDCAVDWENAED
ncbi:MAG: DUF6152 family protein [Gammaproteobacteria bacterium]